MYFYLVIFLQHTCDLSSAMIGLDPGAKLSMWETLGRGREGGREEEGRERGDVAVFVACWTGFGVGPMTVATVGTRGGGGTTPTS